MFKGKFSAEDWTKIREEVQRDTFNYDLLLTMVSYFELDRNLDNPSYFLQNESWKEFFDQAYEIYENHFDIDTTIRDACEFALSQLTQKEWCVVPCPNCGEPILINLRQKRLLQSTLMSNTER